MGNMRQIIRRNRGLDLGREPARLIELTGGPRSRIVTPHDTAMLIRDLKPFRQARPVWDRLDR